MGHRTNRPPEASRKGGRAMSECSGEGAAAVRAREKKQKRNPLTVFLTSPANHVVEWKTGTTFEKARTMDSNEFASHFRRGANSLNGVGWPTHSKEKNKR